MVYRGPHRVLPWATTERIHTMKTGVPVRQYSLQWFVLRNQNGDISALCGVAYVTVVVVFEGNVSLKLSAADVHATSRQAERWELPKATI